MSDRRGRRRRFPRKEKAHVSRTGCLTLACRRHSGFAASATSVVLAVVLTSCAERADKESPEDRDYVVFRRVPPSRVEAASSGEGPRFEPSGVARIGDTDAFLVVSDKEDMASVAVYQLGDSGDRPPSLAEKGSFAVDASKLEAVAASRLNPGVFYLITAFDRPGERENRLIRIELDGQSKLVRAEPLPLAHPKTAVKRAFGYEWLKVEALALSPEEDRLLVGVRAVGPDYRQPLYRVIVLGYSLADLQAEPEVVVGIDLCGAGVLSRPEGISALEYAEDAGGFLLLTSFEDTSVEPPVDQVGGHLWLVPADLSSLNEREGWTGLPRIALLHKPEGTAPVRAGVCKALVVFDDDSDRKSGTGEAGRFALAANEAVFRVIELPRPASSRVSDRPD